MMKQSFKILPDFVSTNNSTTTPLGGGATFTGTGDDCLSYSAVTITLHADVDSATDGMSFQFSTDNSNWDDVIAFTMDVSDSNTRRFQFPVTAQYFRLVYTNGAGAQATFRVQTILHRDNVLTSIHRVSDTLTTDRSAELVRAVIAGETTAGGGSMVNVKVTPSGTLTVEADTELPDAAALADDTSHPTVPGVGAFGMVWDGSTWDRQPGNSDTGVFVGGNKAHDAADGGNPVKTGGIALDYHPDSDDEQGQSEVAANDRVNRAYNLRGEAIEGVNSLRTVLDNISVTYDDDPTTAVSQNIECWNYRWASVGFTITESGTATDILFEVEASLDGTNFFKMMNGGLALWIYDDTTVSNLSPLVECYTFPIACQEIRVRVTCTGTTVSNTFTVANAYIYLRN
jgi:hypothetical protein